MTGVANALKRGYGGLRTDYQLWLCSRQNGDGFQIIGLSGNAKDNPTYELLGGIGFCADNDSMIYPNPDD
jgi:hypothetical protein